MVDTLTPKLAELSAIPLLVLCALMQQGVRPLTPDTCACIRDDNFPRGLSICIEQWGICGNGFADFDILCVEFLALIEMVSGSPLD
jgi:hypothetical protein